jgi:hypothetical protein
MGLFHQIDDAFVILCSRGVYRQAKVFQRDGDVYAGYGNGFVRLYASSNGTSVPHVSWMDAHGVPEMLPDRLGRMALAPAVRTQRLRAAE